MLKYQGQKLYTIPEAAKQIPGGVCDATIRLWIRDGYKGVKLDCVRIGGRRYVAAGSLENFMRATTAVAGAC